MEEIRATVSGKVQGVSFRDFVRGCALEFGVHGYVRNLKEGEVEVLAQGSEDVLRKLVERLHKGPVLAEVKGVNVEWRRPAAIYTVFEIE